LQTKIKTIRESREMKRQERERERTREYEHPRRHGRRRNGAVRADAMIP
jgi:hypothetical protein